MSDAAGDWTLRTLLREVIGSGPKSAADMSPTQAKAAFEQILDRDFDPTTLGAFLLANRWKKNTAEELAAYVDVMHEHSVVTAEPTVSAVDCGANYDGKRSTALLGVAAGIVAAVGGVPIVVHSGDRIPTHRGCTYKHVLQTLEIQTDLSPAASANMVEACNVGFYQQSACNPGVHELLPFREQMGVRTFLNTIETLVDPAGAGVHLGSFYHLAFAKKIIETIQQSEHLSFDRVIMFQGVEGYDEIRPGYTKVAEWNGDTLTDYEIETASFGMDFEMDDLEVGNVPRDSARITEEVLGGTRTDHFADAITLNAAFRLYAGGEATDLDAAVERAEQILDSGEGALLLERLQAFEPDE